MLLGLRLTLCYLNCMKSPAVNISGIKSVTVNINVDILAKEVALVFPNVDGNLLYFSETVQRSTSRARKIKSTGCGHCRCCTFHHALAEKQK